MRLFRFADVVGNSAIKGIISRSLLTDNFPSFSIFSGGSGTGKSTFAEIVALRLVCANPEDDEPCGCCSPCKDAMASILNKGSSRRVKKINLALLDSKEDVKKLIQEVFRLDSGSENVVYIFEEGHSLSIAHQTILLEEIDKVPENVYVMVCTSKPSSLLKEFRNRGIMYKLKSLSPANSRFLIDRECARRLTKIDDKSKNKILSYCHGVPRQIVLNIDNFIKIGGCTPSELDALFGLIDSAEIRNLLESYGDVTEFLLNAEVLIDNSSVSDFLNCFKVYILECCFLSKDLSYRDTYLSSKDKTLAKNIGFGTLLRIYGEVKKLPHNCSTDDLKYTIILCGRIIQKSRPTKSVVTNSTPESRSRASEEMKDLVEGELSNFTKVSTKILKDKINESIS